MIVMIVVAVFAALALAGMVAFWGRRLRAERRYLGATSILDEPEVDADLVQRHEDLAAKAQAAEDDSEAADMRQQLRAPRD